MIGASQVREIIHLVLDKLSVSTNASGDVKQTAKYASL